MSYHFDFDSAHRILRCRFTGRVTDQELKDYYAAAGKLIAQTDAAGGLTDFTGANSVEVSAKTIRQLATLPPLLNETFRVRCIVAPSDQAFALARMFERQGGYARVNLHVVRSMKEALAILGVPEPKFEKLKSK